MHTPGRVRRVHCSRVTPVPWVRSHPAPIVRNGVGRLVPGPLGPAGSGRCSPVFDVPPAQDLADELRDRPWRRSCLPWGGTPRRKRSSLDMADTDQGRQGQQSRTTGILKAGTPAPEFTLNTTPDQRVALSDFRGQPVVLAFYPADWSPVCGDQMTLYNEILPEFRKHNAALLGISVDGVWCHGAFAQARRLHFPLLADFEPKGAVARTYGAYRKG